MDSGDWAGLYKLARLAVLALALVAIALWLFARRRGAELEEPARRMLEEEEP